MKTSSIVFSKAIVLSIMLLLNSGFFAMAAEGSAVPDKPTDSRYESGDLKEDEQDEIPPVVTSLDNSDVRAEDDQIPIAVRINGILRDEGITVYLPSGNAQDEVLVPLGKMMELTSYAITANVGDKKAEGFYVSEENTFQLDLNTNEVLVGGKKRSLEPGEAEIQDDDIYVKASSLEEWFDLKIEIEMTSLTLDVTTNEPLPFQERLKRLANAKKKTRTFKFDAIKPENAALSPYKTFSYPTLYITSSAGAQKNKNSTNFRGLSTVQGYQDLAKFETNYVLSGNYNSLEQERKITGARFTMQRRDLTRSLLGPLHAGRVAFGDVSFPSVPLFVGGQRGAGMQISSDPRLGARYANNTENFVIDGDAPVGYDAELYRNGTFLAFQTVAGDGRYIFENVDLLNGYNNFEIILYGPQGQKSIIKRDIVRGSRMLKKGETQYDFAAGTPKGDLLPITDEANRKDDRTPGMSGQIFYGVNEFLTLGTSAYSGPQELNGITTSSRNFISTPSIGNGTLAADEDIRSTGVAVSAVTAFLGMNVQSQLLAADKGKRAYEVAVNTRPFGFNLGLTHTEYKNFLEENQDIKSRDVVSIYRNFGKFNSRLQVEQRDFLVRADETLFKHDLSFRLLGLSLSNDLVKTVSSDESYDDFEGQISAAATLYGIRLRSSLLYDLDTDAPSRYKTFSFSGQKNLGRRMTFRAEGIHDFQSDIDALSLRLSKDFEKFGLDFDASATTDQNYAFTVGMRVALQPDQHNNYRFIDPSTGGLASLGVRAFIDNNGNNVFDEGTDTLLEGVGFKASNNSNSAETGKDGVAYLSNLGESPLRLSADTSSLQDIYLAPKFDHRDLIPRKGSTPLIDFPFVKMNEIAGYLLHLKEGVEGVIVKLLNAADGSMVEATETDMDGYFIFPAVKGGNYKVSFGLPQKDDFMSLNIVLDASIEDPEEVKVEASDELAAAAKEAAAVRPSASSSGAAQQNRDRMNAPAGDMPNIDDPLNEEDLKELDEKAVEGIITH